MKRHPAHELGTILSIWAHPDDETYLAGGLMAAAVAVGGPDTIVTFGPTGATFHPDHIAVHHWGTVAWQRAGQTGRLLYAATEAAQLGRFRQLFEDLGIYMADQRPVGIRSEDVAVGFELDAAELDRKVAALQAMPSQTAAMFADTDDEVREALLGAETFEAAPADRSRLPLLSRYLLGDAGLAQAS